LQVSGLLLRLFMHRKKKYIDGRWQLTIKAYVSDQSEEEEKLFMLENGIVHTPSIFKYK